MSNLSWLSNKEFAQLLAASGHTPELCAEAARRFEELVDFHTAWDPVETEYESPEGIEARMQALEEAVDEAEGDTKHQLQALYAEESKVSLLEEKVEDLQRELDDMRILAAEDERTCGSCGERL